MEKAAKTLMCVVISHYVKRMRAYRIYYKRLVPLIFYSGSQSEAFEEHLYADFTAGDLKPILVESSRARSAKRVELLTDEVMR